MPKKIATITHYDSQDEINRYIQEANEELGLDLTVDFTSTGAEITCLDESRYTLASEFFADATGSGDAEEFSFTAIEVH